MGALQDDDKYWFNLTTGAVEKGRLSPGVNRAGPFDTAEAAAKAPEIIEARSRKWREDDEAER